MRESEGPDILASIEEKNFIIFDFDGTIARLDVDWAAVRQRVQREVLDGHGLDGSHLFIRVLGRLREVVGEEAFLKAVGILADAEMEAGCQAIPDGMRWFQHAAERGKPVGIFSLNSRRVIEKFLVDEKVLPAEVRIVGFADVRRHKPNPEGLHRLLRDQGAEPGEALFIGDRPDDMEAGRRAGMRTIHVTSP